MNATTRPELHRRSTAGAPPRSKRLQRGPTDQSFGPGQGEVSGRPAHARHGPPRCF